MEVVLCNHLFNLGTAVGSQKSTQALGALSKIKKCLITHKVTTNFLFHHVHQYLTRLFCAQLPFLGLTNKPRRSEVGPSSYWIRGSRPRRKLCINLHTNIQNIPATCYEQLADRQKFRKLLTHPRPLPILGTSF